MIVQVKDALARVRPGVDDHAKAALGDAMLARKPRHDLKNLPDERAVVRVDIEDTDDMLAGNDQNMHRRSWSDISKGHYGIVPINDIRGNFSLDNAAKEAISHLTLLKNSRYESEINRRRPRRADAHRLGRFRS